MQSLDGSQNSPEKRSHIISRLLDGVWACTATTLALVSLRDAWRFADLQAFVFFALHLQAAVLFSIRGTAVYRSERVVAYVVAVASTLYVYLFEFAPRDPTLLHRVGEATTLIGSAMTLAATYGLGRCYGVLPIVRGLRTQNAYGIVRHPIYASYILMDVGILLAYPSARNATIFTAALILYLIRVGFEEEVLGKLDGFDAYRSRVPFRFAPGIF